MKKNKNFNIIIFLISSICLIGLCLIYPKLPDRIPTHWNLSGQVDLTGPKWSLFILWGIGVVMDFFFQAVKKIDPKSENFNRFSKLFNVFRLLMILFFMSLVVVSVVFAIEPDAFNMNNFMLVSIGIMFIVLGNYLPKCKINYTFGIKTPWTFASENVWNKTHRMAGPIWVITGILFLGLIFIDSEIKEVLIVAIIIVPTIIPIIYSYLEYRKEMSGK